jgi:hypothetical protein
MTGSSPAAALAPAIESQPKVPALAWRVVAFPVKFFLGLVFCQSLAGSLLLIGWTYRLAQRSAFKRWFSLSRKSSQYASFARFATAQDNLREHVQWPNWIVRQNLWYHLRSDQGMNGLHYAWTCMRALVGSLWLNWWRGLRGIANTLAVTLPAGILWWFGWYDGWNNSFNKGYEQAAVGPLISFLGIAWFIAAMFYVPLAQARQAVTGDWRAFYDFKLIWRLARARWPQCVLLAISYLLLSIPLAVLKTSPMFWMHDSNLLGSMTPVQVISMLTRYFFWCGLLVVPAYVGLHWLGARVYATALVVLLQKGEVHASELRPTERAVLDGLEFLGPQPERQKRLWLRAATWAGTRLGRMVGATLLVLIWFGFVAQIYISEFLNYHSGIGWLNQPLVQLPWFRYFPKAAHNPIGDLASAALLILVAVLLRSIVRALRAFKR